MYSTKLPCGAWLWGHINLPEELKPGRQTLMIVLRALVEQNPGPAIKQLADKVGTS